ncbi:MAG: aldo/keto reductase [Rhodospirillales bacterium]|nr:aldo/keto reductase [Alphaproteobacteria bacterium]USO03444.1 MAG: aldo/keto reductase [Rhodospirillales bacterium]
MKYSNLGTSGLKVSRVCLGTMTWGQQNSEAQGHEQMDYALEREINFFDTAELYAVPISEPTSGRTEEIIGTWFQKSRKREKVILATKVAGPGISWIRGGEPLTGQSVRTAVEGSLKRLQTDYIDVYQLHWPNRPIPHFGHNHAGVIDFAAEDTAEIEDNLLDILEALGKIVKEGKVRHTGLSDDTAWGIMKYNELAKAHGLPRMVSIQNEFSLLDRSDDPYVAETCVRENVAYLPWSPLASGMISGKYQNGARPENARWAVATRVRPEGFDAFRSSVQAHAAVDAYIAVAKKHGLDVCQMALKFIDKQNFVTSTIIGATSMAQLTSNIDAFDMDLPDEVMADIDAVYRKYPIPY